MTAEELAHAFALKLARAAQDNPDQAAILPEAAIETLKEVAARYVADCPFKVGDIVTPRRGFSVRGAGRPNVVLEVIGAPIRNFVTFEPDHTGLNSFGRKIDMRVVEADGNIRAFWVESWAFEAYEVAEA